MPCSRILLTPGEPAGIGPELIVRLAQQQHDNVQLVVIGDPKLLAQTAEQLKLPLNTYTVTTTDTPIAHKPATLAVVPTMLAEHVIPGTLNSNNAPYVLATLKIANDWCLEGYADAIVTGPVQKSIINDAGIPFSGHTEFFAEHSHTDNVVMMLATEGLRVALATTHLPLRHVADALTRDELTTVIRILHADMHTKFGIPHPKILVCGLNPHAGEGGHLGTEERDVITPLLDELRQEGLDLVGPLPADTLFTPPWLERADAVLAMYHDQGLPVLKFKGFGDAVNITLGLPYIRTSVDHGTALDLAGTGKANLGSLQTALAQAIMLVHTQSTSTAL